MKLSARNVLPATVKSVTPGAVDSEVIYAIIKASNVMIGVD
jgi:molybdopterin-binding protein